MPKNSPITQIESPFSAPTRGGIVRNVYYTMLAVRDSLERGEVPYASHLFYTQMLDDNTPHERQLGIDAGLIIGRLAELTAVYVDLGVSRGMEYGIESAKKAGRSVEIRRLFDEQLSAGELEGEILRAAEQHSLPSAEAMIGTYARILPETESRKISR